MFTLAFLKAEIAEYFQLIQTTFPKLIEIYDAILRQIFSFDIFYDDQEKRHVCHTPVTSAVSVTLIIVLLIYSAIAISYVYHTNLPYIILALVFILVIIAIVDIITHHISIQNMEVFLDNMNREETRKLNIFYFNKIFGFFPPDFGDEIYDVKIASRQKEVTAKLLTLDDLRQESFTEQRLIREKIAAFSQGEFAENPKQNTDKAKSLTEEKQKIDFLTEQRKSDYNFARQLAWDFHYQVPGTKKRP